MLTRSDERIPQLDGLRGAAALAVVVAHYFGEVPHGLPPLTFAWVGVDVFFALSGFLIGSIILEQKGSSNFLQVFYLRRALRILPIYLATILICFIVWGIFSTRPWAHAPLAFLSYVTFTQNILMSVTGIVDRSWLLPTWTLAVEEQFYLLLPILVLAIPRRWLLPMIVGLMLSSLAFRAFFADVQVGTFGVLLFNRGDVLLSGVLAAHLSSTRYFERVDESLQRYVPLVCVLVINGAILLGPRSLSVVGPLCIGTGCSAYFLLARRGSEILRVLTVRPLLFLGSISYGLYLIHQPVSGLLHGLVFEQRPDIGTLAQLLISILALIVSIGLAWLSWRYMERPLIRYGHRWTYQTPTSSPHVGAVCVKTKI